MLQQWRTMNRFLQMSIMKNTSPGIRDYDRIQDVYLAIYLLAMSTTLVNPIVYYSINSKFRQYFHRYAYILIYCPCHIYKSYFYIIRNCINWKLVWCAKIWQKNEINGNLYNALWAWMVCFSKSVVLTRRRWLLSWKFAGCRNF